MKIWHPFSQSSDEQKINIVSAKDEYLIDSAGNAHIDLISSWWTCIHGHCNSYISDAISKQAKALDHVMFSDFTHSSAVKLSENLDRATHGLFEKFFFSDNGSTSTEVALKIAYQYWKNSGQDRNIIISFEGNYHGDTLGAMSLGGKSGFFKPFEDLMCRVEFLPYPQTWIGCEDAEHRENLAIRAFEEIIAKNSGKIACIVLEPLVQGAAGMRFSSVNFLQNIMKIARQNGIITILDEVMTGFYRTGKMFAYQNTNEKPDIICLSKAITGGFLPLGITCVTRKIYQEFADCGVEKSFLHGHSYTANPIICAAANASFDLTNSSKTIDLVKNIADIYQDFVPIFQKIPGISKVRTMGVIFAFSCSGIGEYGSENSQKLKQMFLQNFLNIRPLGSEIYLLPPYCISSENLTISLEKIAKIIGDLSPCG